MVHSNVAAELASIDRQFPMMPNPQVPSSSSWTMKGWWLKQKTGLDTLNFFWNSLLTGWHLELLGGVPVIKINLYIFSSSMYLKTCFFFFSRETSAWKAKTERCLWDNSQSLLLHVFQLKGFANHSLAKAAMNNNIMCYCEIKLICQAWASRWLVRLEDSAPPAYIALKAFNHHWQKQQPDSNV